MKLLTIKLVAAKPIHLATSESVDDYLKAILELGGAEDSRVTTNALATRLGVRTPSVTGMLQKLASQRPALVLYEKHRGVRLTAAGKAPGLGTGPASPSAGIVSCTTF